MNRKLQNLLDSDDEFPSDFEDYDPPRCNYINDKPETNTDKDNNIGAQNVPYLLKNGAVCMKAENLTTTIRSDEENNTKILKAVLSKEDILCLNTIRSVFDNTTILWFLDFLIKKDLNSHNTFLKSCLVREIF